MNQPSVLEITVISAQGLKASSASTLFFHRRLRPFATVTTGPPPPPFTYKPAAAITTTSNIKRLRKVYKTKVDDKGGFNPIWGDKFQLPLDATFFNDQTRFCIYLLLYTKNFLLGYTHLGWCQIPVTDILDGLLPAGSLRHLAYHLRARDGSRGHGIVNVAVKLQIAGSMVHPQRSSFGSNTQYWPEMNVSRMVMGIPADCNSTRLPEP